MMALMASVMMSLTTQAKTQDVGGRVIDQNGEPLGFVSAALLSADSTYIQGATSDENGAFMIQTTDACCILRLSFVGYRTQYMDVKGTNVGTIQMEEDLPLLNEIIIKGQMPKTKLTGNSMVTTIQGTILGTSGTLPSSPSGDGPVGAGSSESGRKTIPLSTMRSTCTR